MLAWSHTCIRMFMSVCLTFSPVIANGVLNHCSNVAQDLNMVGRRKLSRAQSSGRLFYSHIHNVWRRKRERRWEGR